MDGYRVWMNKQKKHYSTFWSWILVLVVNTVSQRNITKASVSASGLHAQNWPPRSSWVSPCYRTWMNIQKQCCSTFWSFFGVIEAKMTCTEIVENKGTKWQNISWVLVTTPTHIIRGRQTLLLNGFSAVVYGRTKAAVTLEWKWNWKFQLVKSLSFAHSACTYKNYRHRCFHCLKTLHYSSVNSFIVKFLKSGSTHILNKFSQNSDTKVKLKILRTKSLTSYRVHVLCICFVW